MNKQALLAQILGRKMSLFQADVEANRKVLGESVQGKSLLIIGAAGSIGSSFVHQVASYQPGKLHLVDLSENNLAELVRDLRSSEITLPEDFATFSVALGTPEFAALLASQPPYDVVMNFSALKHVRAERDPFTLMRLLHTNVLAFGELLNALSEETRVFSVSSDKAVNPANIMGSSKWLMEQLMWASGLKTSSARFANVAFSDGSLLYSFLRRLEKNQPLSAPSDVRRYFISHREAGQLCLLACFLGESREVFVPRLKPETDLMSFADIARTVLTSQGLKALACGSEAEAKAAMRARGGERDPWPCHFMTSDTSGEKAFEEFYTSVDEVDTGRFAHIGVVQEAAPSPAQRTQLELLLTELSALRSQDNWTKADLVSLVKEAVPSLEHQETHKNLDQKM